MIENSIPTGYFVHMDSQFNYEELSETVNESGIGLQLKRRLRPILFSHGQLRCPTDYSGLISDLVSRGYVVFAVYHQDGTCSYTQDEKGKSLIFNVSAEEVLDK
jgi:hypothetical protein